MYFRISPICRVLTFHGTYFRSVNCIFHIRENATQRRIEISQFIWVREKNFIYFVAINAVIETCFCIELGHPNCRNHYVDFAIDQICTKIHIYLKIYVDRNASVSNAWPVRSDVISRKVYHCSFWVLMAIERTAQWIKEYTASHTYTTHDSTIQ